MAKVEARAPRECSAEEQAVFAAMVLKGREVTAAGLRRRVDDAVALAFLRVKEELLGVGGLKRPDEIYCGRVSNASGVALPASEFAFELGWVYVEQKARGGASRALCEALLPFAKGHGVFATSRVNNPWMHATLLGLGFARVGAEWPSGQNPANLALFTRTAGAA